MCWPLLRYRKDALRILRALRFSSVLAFSIERETAHAIIKHRALLKRVSPERISSELGKFICGKNAGDVLIRYAPVFYEFIPELKPMDGFKQNTPYHTLDVWRHTVKALTHCPPELILRLTILLHDIGKPQCYTEKNGIGHFYSHAIKSADMAREILTRLRYDSAVINEIQQLILIHGDKIQPDRKSVKTILRKTGQTTLMRLLKIKKADTLGKNPKIHKETLQTLEEISNISKDILSTRQCYSLKDLAVNGYDLMARGFPGSPEIGEILNWLLDMVIDERLPNEKTALLLAAESEFYT